MLGQSPSLVSPLPRQYSDTEKGCVLHTVRGRLRGRLGCRFLRLHRCRVLQQSVSAIRLDFPTIGHLGNPRRNLGNSAIEGCTTPDSVSSSAQRTSYVFMVRFVPDEGFSVMSASCPTNPSIRCPSPLAGPPGRRQPLPCLPVSSRGEGQIPVIISK